MTNDSLGSQLSNIKEYEDNQYHLYSIIQGWGLRDATAYDYKLEEITLNKINNFHKFKFFQPFIRDFKLLMLVDSPYIINFQDVQGMSVQFHRLAEISSVIDSSLTRNYMPLRIIIFILCNFTWLLVIGEISILWNFT